MDVPALLRFARARAGIDQRQLAERAGTARSVVTAYESGARTPSVRTLERLVALCGLEVTATLQPLTAELDRRLDEALDGEAPDHDSLLRLATALDGAGARWAFDRETALHLTGHGLSAFALGLTVQLDDGGRRWLCGSGISAVDQHGFRMVPSWWDTPLEDGARGLAHGTWTVGGPAKVRLVEVLPPTTAVPLDGRPVPVLPADEVERAHPDLAELMARLRERGAGAD